MSNPYEALQAFVEQIPTVVQPLIVAIIGMIPYVEGEGSSALGIIAGVHPVAAGIAGATGNIVSVLLVVLLGSRIRERVLARRALAAAPASTVATAPVSAGSGAAAADPGAEPITSSSSGTATSEKRADKGRRKLQRWLVRFGVPGASLLAPLALPTQLTAAFFVASGMRREWVIAWQVVAIVLWTTAVTLAATGVITALGW
jgi:hypothetical protein